MRTNLLRSTVFIMGFLLVPTAQAEADPTSDDCDERYRLPTLTINNVVEKTGHNPKQFLIRRCKTKLRKAEMKDRAAERRAVREAVKREKTDAKGSALLQAQKSQQKRNIRRNIDIKRNFRTRDAQERIQKFVEERRSRRAIIQNAEQVNRTNAIYRKLWSEKRGDLCQDVGVIGKRNNPCKRYGSYRSEQ